MWYDLIGIFRICTDPLRTSYDLTKKIMSQGGIKFIFVVVLAVRFVVLDFFFFQLFYDLHLNVTGYWIFFLFARFA